MFFGAPHRGLETTAFETMAENMPGDFKLNRVRLVQSLKKEAECLETRLERFFALSKQKTVGSLRIISFFEKRKTAMYDRRVC